MIVGALPGSVEIETLFAGGSFGRRANFQSDYVAECVHIAKHVGGGRPVKLVWTREDDMTGGYYRPLAHHDVKVDARRRRLSRRLAPPGGHPVDHEGLAHGRRRARRDRRRGRQGLALPRRRRRSSTARCLRRRRRCRCCGGARWARPTPPSSWSTPSTSWRARPARTRSTTAARSTPRPARSRHLAVLEPGRREGRLGPAGRRLDAAASPCTRASARWWPRSPR